MRRLYPQEFVRRRTGMYMFQEASERTTKVLVAPAPRSPLSQVPLVRTARIWRSCFLTTAYEVYNLGAQSYVRTQFETSEKTADVNCLGVLRLLNAIRSAGLEKQTKVYQDVRTIRRGPRGTAK